MIKLITDGTISSKIAKKVFKELIEKGGNAADIVKEKGLVQISDEGTLRTIVTETLDANEQSIEDYKNGKDRAVGFLVGQIMKAQKGKQTRHSSIKSFLRKSRNGKYTNETFCIRLFQVLYRDVFCSNLVI